MTLFSIPSFRCGALGSKKLTLITCFGNLCDILSCKIAASRHRGRLKHRKMTTNCRYWMENESQWEIWSTASLINQEKYSEDGNVSTSINLGWLERIVISVDGLAMWPLPCGAATDGKLIQWRFWWGDGSNQFLRKIVALDLNLTNGTIARNSHYFELDFSFQELNLNQVDFNCN